MTPHLNSLVETVHMRGSVFCDAQRAFQAIYALVEIFQTAFLAFSGLNIVLVVMFLVFQLHSNVYCCKHTLKCSWNCTGTREKSVEGKISLIIADSG